MIPWRDCGGQGIAHCCDVICEQPHPELMNESKHRLRRSDCESLVSTGLRQAQSHHGSAFGPF
jgi:hypothetical protein